MARLSSLVGGGGGSLPYVAGALYPLTQNEFSSSSSTPNQDRLMPFSPRQTLTISEVAWRRDQTTAATVYVGIYDLSGNLLTDCAGDTDTTEGWHMVSTTPVTLVPSQFYYFCWNASADVASTVAPTSDSYRSPSFNFDYGQHVHIGASPMLNGFVAYSKTRTNAALLSSLTLSGWAGEVYAIYMGFIAS